MGVYLSMVSERLTLGGFEAKRKKKNSPWQIPGIMKSGLYSAKRSIYEVGERSVVFGQDGQRKKPNGKRPIAVHDREDHSWRIEEYVDVEEGDLIVVGHRGYSSDSNVAMVTIFQIAEFQTTEDRLRSEVKLEKLQEETYNESTKVDVDSKLIAKFDPKYHKAIKKALKIKLHGDYWFPDFRHCKVI